MSDAIKPCRCKREPTVQACVGGCEKTIIFCGTCNTKHGYLYVHSNNDPIGQWNQIQEAPPSFDRVTAITGRGWQK